MLMRKFVLCLFLLAFVSSSFAQEAPLRTVRRGDAAGYTSRDATVLSMFVWGVGLAAGIVLLCTFLEEQSSSSGSSSH